MNSPLSFSTPKPYLYNTSTVNLYTCIKQAQINNAAKLAYGVVVVQVPRKGKVKSLENGGHILTPFQQPTLKTVLTHQNHSCMCVEKSTTPLHENYWQLKVSKITHSTPLEYKKFQSLILDDNLALSNTKTLIS